MPATEKPSAETTGPAATSAPKQVWAPILLGLTASFVLFAATVWLIGQFLKHRPRDLKEATADVGEIATDVLKYQGVPSAGIEISAPRLQREPGAHFYRTRVSAHLPDSMRPDDVVRAVERALWPKRIIISAENARNSEIAETFSLDGHPIGELVLYHTPARPVSQPQISIQKPPRPAADAKPPVQPDRVIAPEEQEPPIPFRLPASERPGEMPELPAGLWAPMFGPIVRGAREKVAQAPARLAVIVDDGGYGGEPSDIILGLDHHLTFSILPNTPHCTALAKEAERRGFEVMLHMPMENTSPTLVHPGQIDARMTAADMQRLLKSALEQIPGAVGINNHTGSKFTADSKALGRFMEGLQSSHLFFIDSRTTQDSVAYEVARQFRIPAAVRNLFLDDEKDPETIRARFRELIADAKTQGAAIGICHFRITTAQVLREVLPTLGAEGVTLVHASELVR